MQKPPLYIWFFFILSSCVVRSVYVPPSQNVMLFDEKKQLQTSAFLGLNSFQLHIAHNPVKHLNLGLNTTYGAGLNILEGCVGFYNYSKNESKWRYEILAGGGLTENYSEVTHGSLAALQNKNSNFETISSYTKIFVQPTLGYFSKINMYKLKYSFSIGTRLSRLQFQKFIYREIDADRSDPNGTQTYVVNKTYYNKSPFLIEPCITNKVGRGNLYGILQLLVISPYSNEIDVRDTKFSPGFLLSAGIQYNLVFRKKTP